MDSKQIFKKYYSRLAIEGIIKALLLALVVGMAAGFVVAFATFMALYNGLWFSIGAIIVVTAAVAPIFYFKLFRPSTKRIAERIDRLGLDERLITMMELENDQSYIAMRQREDAKEKLSGVSKKSLKFKFSKLTIAAVTVVSALAITMTVFSALNAANPGMIYGDNPEGTAVSVSYEAADGGMIEGMAEQMLIYGEDAQPVFAVANDWYAFEQWSDGVKTPERTDIRVTENIKVTAIFVALEEGKEQMQGDPNKEANPGDDPPPSRPDGDTQDPVDSGKDPGSSTPSGEEDKRPNSFGNGEDWIGDFVDGKYEENVDIVESNPEIPDYMRDMMEEYYKYIGGGK